MVAGKSNTPLRVSHIPPRRFAARTLLILDSDREVNYTDGRV